MTDHGWAMTGHEKFSRRVLPKSMTDHGWPMTGHGVRVERGFLRAKRDRSWKTMTGHGQFLKHKRGLLFVTPTLFLLPLSSSPLPKPPFLRKPLKTQPKILHFKPKSTLHSSNFFYFSSNLLQKPIFFSQNSPISSPRSLYLFLKILNPFSFKWLILHKIPHQ